MRQSTLHKLCFVFVSFLTPSIAIFAGVGGDSVNIVINASAQRKLISPNIYGRNNNLSDDTSNPVSPANWQLYKDAGLRFYRESGGNNSSKYNWRRKLTSQPDWYNNVYAHDWDYEATTLQQNIPGTKGMWALQLIGWAASNTNNNFNDYAFNKSQWWSGVEQNLAGGGIPDTAGGSIALVSGDSSLYLMPWPADSTIGILNKWFTNGLNLSDTMFNYWNMDNEPEVWNSTHDDVITTALTAEGYLQKYFAVAKAARQAFPNIKLVGPVSANEWQWYNWNNNLVTDTLTGVQYVWMEYFIKRVAEEQVASGMRLLDVLDIHFYPGSNNDSITTAQLYRVFFDSTYAFPFANGVHRLGGGGWDPSIQQEYIYQRCSKWLTQYMGANNGVNFGLSEFGSIYSNNPNVVAVCYASMLGTFASHNVELFSPWDWDTGMWEVLHLYSRYAQEVSVQSLSDRDTLVSAYTSVNVTNDSMTVMLVNRHPQSTFNANVSLSNYTVPNGSYPTYRLSQLPQTETFVSQTQNALVENTVTVTNNTISINLPPYSITALRLTGTGTVTGLDNYNNEMTTTGGNSMTIIPNPVSQSGSVSFTLLQAGQTELVMYDVFGNKTNTIVSQNLANGSYSYSFETSNLAAGMYYCVLKAGNQQLVQRVVVAK